jgi:hypothetical protein
MASRRQPFTRGKDYFPFVVIGILLLGLVMVLANALGA